MKNKLWLKLSLFPLLVVSLAAVGQIAEEDSETDNASASGSEEMTLTSHPWGKTEGNIGVVSDYIFRGHTQSNHQPALQGGVDWTHPYGFYGSAWGSNFITPEDPNTVLELDFSAGYTLKVWRALTASVGATYYTYYKNIGTNTWDFPFRLSWGGWKAGFNYSPKLEGNPGDAWYLTGGWSDEVPGDFTLGVTVGYSLFSDASELKNYADFRVALSREIFGLTAEAALSFVDFEQTESADGPRIVLGLFKNF